MLGVLREAIILESADSRVEIIKCKVLFRLLYKKQAIGYYVNYEYMDNKYDHARPGLQVLDPTELAEKVKNIPHESCENFKAVNISGTSFIIMKGTAGSDWKDLDLKSSFREMFYTSSNINKQIITQMKQYGLAELKGIPSEYFK